MLIKQECVPKEWEIVNDVAKLSIFMAVCSKIDINIISGKLNFARAKAWL